MALIGDLVRSRQAPARASLQEKLAGALAEINRRKPRLASPYTITLGDEFQAVYRTADRLFIDIFSIMLAIYPAQARFGVGIGELTTPVNPKQALGMDGPVFHRARAAISELRDSGYLIALHGDPAPQGPAFDAWPLFNHVLNFVSHKIGSWERNRLQIMVGLLQGRTVAELEAQLSISNVAVYKNINSAALNELKGLTLHITKYLNVELES